MQDAPPRVGDHFLTRDGMSDVHRAWLRTIRRHWKSLVIALTPILLCPLPIVAQASEASCLFVILIMATYWMTEAIPLPITALFPLFLFPPFGILTAKRVASEYLTDSNFVFVGSMMMALGVEESGLQERIALRILLTMGSNPRLIMLGFTFATAFLSMWMSNTATTAMMVPIALAVINELHAFHRLQGTDTAVRSGSDQGAIVMEDMQPQTREETRALDDVVNAPPEQKRLYKAILLSICYSANIGGTGTLTGTGSNVVFSGLFAGFYPQQDSISFATWMAFALPQMLLLLLVNWLWLQIFFLGIKFQEKVMLFFFVLLVVLWLTREPKIFPGWGSLFPHDFVDDGTTAMFIGCVLFLHKFSWSIVLLLGGAYAMAAGVKESGLSDLIGCALSGLNSWPKLAFMALCVSCVTFLTEFSSNVATASIFIPIIDSVAVGMEENPLYFLLPVTLACSFAFMLPVATPPNAIVFSARLLHVSDMVSAGFVMNLLCIGVTILNVETYGTWLLGLGTKPHWANATLGQANATLC